MDARTKRKHLRHTTRIPVKVRVMGKDGKKVWSGHGTISNIGDGGVLLELAKIDEQTAQKLSEKEHVFQLSFSLPNLWLQVRVAAEVAWVKMLEESGASKHQFGMTFSDLPEKRGRRITKYVESQVIGELVERAFQRAVKNFRKRTTKSEQK